MKPPFALIIEPNDSIITPYSYLDDIYSYERCVSIERGLRIMAERYPDIVFLSASYTISKSLKVLESLKQKSTISLIPIILVVDLSHKISHIPGTTWGEKIGIVSTISTKKELNSTLDRVNLI